MTTAIARDANQDQSPPALRRSVNDHWVIVAALLSGIVVAWLVTTDRAALVLAATALLPAVVLVHRAPLASIAIWLAVQPFLTDGVARPAFWAVHRGLPLAVLAAMALRRGIGMEASRRQVRLGWPEVLMLGYVAVTAVSILYTSVDVIASLIHLYDRVVVPMMLYLIIRMTQQGGRSLRWLAPIAVLLIVAQSVAGVLQWVAPSTLPSAWLSRAGERTTGTLSSPPVYGVTLLAAGVLALHLASHALPRHRRTLQFACAWALIAAILSFTRAVWLATALMIVISTILYPRLFARLAIPAAALLAIFVISGAAARQIDTVEQRFGDEQTAMSRLPVMQASVRMFEQKPWTGWGYENFDLYDRDFQDSINGFYPEKDQASHNLYLTLLAEQGLLGFGLYVSPAVLWLHRSVRSYQRLPRGGVFNRQLLILLWAILGTHVVVNQFSNMQHEYGLGVWWLTLGLIASIVSQLEDEPRTTWPNRSAHREHLP